MTGAFGAGVNGEVLLAGLLGAGGGLGAWLLLLGVLGVRVLDLSEDGPGARDPQTRGPWARWARGRPVSWRRLATCVAVGLAVGAITRWPVAALLAGCGAWALPALVGPDREHQRRVARIEAVATWTESLRDTLAAAAGLEQAIVATASMAPEPIRDEVGLLAGRLRRGDRLADALRGFAADLDDATGDLVVTALVLAAERNARHIADLLGLLATAARDQATLRMQTAAARAHIRTSTRVITGVTLVMAGGLVLLNRGYLQPYDTALGQLVLAVTGLVFTAGFAWLAAIAKPETEPRVLAIPDAYTRLARGIVGNPS